MLSAPPTAEVMPTGSRNRVDPSSIRASAEDVEAPTGTNECHSGDVLRRKIGQRRVLVEQEKQRARSAQEKEPHAAVRTGPSVRRSGEASRSEVV